MLMDRRVLVLAMAGAFASGPVWAESSRLAFSKAENIEIFVEHATGTPWCSDHPDLRVVFHGSTDLGALERLMPKLGALMGQQCPQASSLTWQGQDKAGKVVANGSSSQAAQWRMVLAPASSGSGVVAAAPAAPATTPATPAPAATPAPVAMAPAASVAAAAPAAPASAAPAVTAAGSPEAVPATVPADKTADDNAAAEQAAIEKVAAEKRALEQAAAEKAAAEARQQTLGAADFDVKGWKPQSEAAVLAASPFLKEMQDQNGCKIRAGFNLGQDAQYVSLLSEGVTCTAGGYAQGTGRLTLQRSDGAVIGRTNKLYFNNGYAFDEPVQTAVLVGTNGKDTLWFGLGNSPAFQAYFLLRVRVAAGYVFSSLDVNGNLDVLTAQDGTFRQAADISQALNASLTALQTVALPQARSVNVRFSDSLEGLLNGDREHMMYAIQASRDWNYAKRVAVGDWKYQLARGDNYVFAREKRKAEQERQRQQQAERAEAQRQQQLAWEKRRALQNQAQKAERQLAQYQELVSKDKAAPDSLLQQYFVRSTPYVPFQGRAYARLYSGGAMDFQQIVRVSGHDDAEAVVDYPYDLRISGGQDLKESWYAVRGKATADPKRLDEDGLPMTVVMPGADNGVQPCKKEGCADLADPLTVMRLLHGVPDWTPEAAQRQIDQARAEG